MMNDLAIALLVLAIIVVVAWAADMLMRGRH